MDITLPSIEDILWWERGCLDDRAGEPFANDPTKISTWDSKIKYRFKELCDLRRGDEVRGAHKTLIIEKMQTEFQMTLDTHHVCRFRNYIKKREGQGMLESFLEKSFIIQGAITAPDGSTLTKSQMEIFAYRCNEWVIQRQAGVKGAYMEMTALVEDLAKEQLIVSSEWVMSRRRKFCSSVEKIAKFREQIQSSFPETMEGSRKRKR
ncbi:MAG: hypothetical protein KBC64_07980 [Simkaniaceae bacterium]|nr:hypothetical protein [Simkaniaceae bacterium]